MRAYTALFSFFNCVILFSLSKSSLVLCNLPLLNILLISRFPKTPSLPFSLTFSSLLFQAKNLSHSSPHLSLSFSTTINHPSTMPLLFHLSLFFCHFHSSSSSLFSPSISLSHNFTLSLWPLQISIIFLIHVYMVLLSLFLSFLFCYIIVALPKTISNTLY